MGRYDFVDPYVARHWTQDAGATLNDVLDSERARRAELENKRRFDESMAVQQGYLKETQTRGVAERTTEGFQGGDVSQWNPDESATAHTQRRGAEIWKDQARFGDDLARGRQTDIWNREDRIRDRMIGSFVSAGAKPEDAGALAENPQVWDRLNPDAGWDAWFKRGQQEHNWRLGEIGARERYYQGRGGGGGQGRDYLPGLRARIDDFTGEIAQEQGRKSPYTVRPDDAFDNRGNPLIDHPWVRDSTAFETNRTRRINTLMGQRRVMQTEHDRILGGELGLPPDALSGNVNPAGDQYGPGKDGMVQYDQEATNARNAIRKAKTPEQRQRIMDEYTRRTGKKLTIEP